MLSRSFFPNFGQEPFPKIAGKSPAKSGILYGAWTDSKDTDQMSQILASDKDLHCLLTAYSIEILNNTCTTQWLSHGAQWLSGRVLDLRPKGSGFDPHRRHCVVSLSKTH